jgi:hypothetical protein
MDARQVAAQFAAYSWFENTRRGEPTEAEKSRFARENWRPFLTIAPQGLGRLLLKVAAGRRRNPRRRQRRELLTVA